MKNYSLMPKKMSFLALMSFFSCLTFASGPSDDRDLTEVMTLYQAKGTIVIVSEDNRKKYIHNYERANTPFSPASTFKIPNSIIALEEKVIKDQFDIIKWDGTHHELETWNQDHNLKTAYRASCVWFYQELAKKIGKRSYDHYLNRFDYGNAKTGNELTNFWLEGYGDLQISALEQITFLQKLEQKRFRLSKKTYHIVEDIMLDESRGNCKIYAKTGAGTRDWQGHGWYVGYLKTPNDTWYFATNIVINNKDDLAKRKDITLAAFEKKGIMPTHS